jgi:hypothetical protein
MQSNESEGLCFSLMFELNTVKDCTLRTMLIISAINNLEYRIVTTTEMGITNICLRISY